MTRILAPGDYRRTRRAIAGHLGALRLGALAQGGVFDSLGVTVWEWLHPEQLRAEAEAVGYTGQIVDPTFGDVIGAAAEDTRDVLVSAREEITEGAATVVGGASKLALGLGVAAAVAAVIYLSQKRGRK